MNARTKMLGAAASLTLLLIAQCLVNWNLMGSSSELMRETWATGHEGTKRALEIKLDVVQVQQWLQDISATRAAENFDDGFVEAEKYAKLFRANAAELARLRTPSPARCWTT